MAYYWLCKMGFKRSQQEVYQSSIAKKDRLRRRRDRFDRKLEEFELQWSLILRQRLEQAKTFRRRYKTVEDHVCSACGNSWPMSKVFFSRLPGSFTFGGRNLDGFQTEFCRFCSDSTTARLTLYRYYNRSVREILARRLAQRRIGLDLAVERLIGKAKEARDKRFRKPFNLDTRDCIRCQECWPLDKRYFRPNRGTADGEPTFRALCVFCDGYFERNIDRCKRDGRSPKALIAERTSYLAQARAEEREARRQRACKLREKILERQPKLWVEVCESCDEPWPTSGSNAKKFWRTNQHNRVSGERS
jgi:ribosomal protein L44E